MKQRDTGVDLLRMLAMWMVVILHILNKGGVLAATAPLSAGQETARLLEAGAYCAVNCYGLISGYVGAGRRFRYSSIMVLWLRVTFYTVGITAAFALCVPGSVTGDRALRAVFPVLFRQYWYVTAYFGMVLLIPFFKLLLEQLTRRQAYVLMSSIVLTFSVLPTLRQKDVFLTENGYSMLWLSCLYILGGCLKRYGPNKRPGHWAALYGLCVLMTWGLRFGMDRLWMRRTGTTCDRVLLTTYTSPTILLAAVSLLLCFAGLRVPKGVGSLVGKVVSPLAFSVYLIHAHPLIWEHWMAGRFAHFADRPAGALAISVLGAAFGVYAVCSLADLFRVEVFRLLRVKTLSEKAEAALAARLQPWFNKE